MGIIDEIIQKVSDHISGIFGNLFNGEFWSLVGATSLVIPSAFAIGYFFPALRSFCGAVVMTVVGVWYGFDKGQKSRGD